MFAATPQILPPSAQDILRYRYHHGTNLGGIFVLERWIHGSMFDADATGDSELDAVTSYATPKSFSTLTLTYFQVLSKFVASKRLKQNGRLIGQTHYQIPILTGFRTLHTVLRFACR